MLESMCVILNTTDEELLQYYKNAAATDCGSIGHTKGAMNKIAAKKYAAELAERKLSIPDYYVAAEEGTYNGKGSF